MLQDAAGPVATDPSVGDDLAEMREMFDGIAAVYVKPVRQFLARLADWLETDAQSPVVRHTRKGEDIDAVIDFRAVFQQTFDQLAYENMPSLLKPKTGKLGLQDHEKVFCVDHKGAGNIFDMRGIDRDQGCMIVVRPDQYVAHVLPLDGFDELSAYFAGVLR